MSPPDAAQSIHTFWVSVCVQCVCVCVCEQCVCACVRVTSACGPSPLRAHSYLHSAFRDVGQSDEDLVSAMAKDILDRLPAVFDVEKAQAKFPVRYEESMNQVTVLHIGGGRGEPVRFLPQHVCYGF